jgi:hypothetical protein
MPSYLFEKKQRSMSTGLSLLQVLFVVHICTTLFTIVNALQQQDNEGSLNKRCHRIDLHHYFRIRLAIIQLSADSIHVVTPSDSRLTVRC